MTRLKILASLVQDAYYGQYAKESDFFKIEDFEAYCAPFFYKVLQEDFEKTRKEMIILGLIMAHEEPQLNVSWFKIKEFDVVKEGGQYVVNIPSMFSFSKDMSFSGINGVYPVGDEGDCCGQFAKITANQCQSLRFLPKSDKTIYWYPLGNKILFKKVECGLKKVNVGYIPSLDDECDDENEVVVPDSYVSEIMTLTYNFMVSARNGAVIDKTNNQNQNKLIQTEIDT